MRKLRESKKKLLLETRATNTNSLERGHLILLFLKEIYSENLRKVTDWQPFVTDIRHEHFRRKKIILSILFDFCLKFTEKNAKLSQPFIKLFKQQWNKRLAVANPITILLSSLFYKLVYFCLNGKKPMWCQFFKTKISSYSYKQIIVQSNYSL